MKERFRNKLPDVLLTIVSTVIAIYILSLTNAWIESFLVESLKASVQRVNFYIGIYFTVLVAVIYVAILGILVLFQMWTDFLSSPKITICFEDKKGKTAHEIDFKDQPDEPKYLKVSFLAKFSSFQLFVLKDLCKAKVLISLNPNMCAIELHEGFIGDNQHYNVVEGALQCDIFSLFQESKEEQRLYIELSLLLMNPAKGEIKAKLGFSNSFLNFLFKNYCKFQVSTIILEG